MTFRQTLSPYRRGYVIAHASSIPPTDVAFWTSLETGQWRLYLEPSTPWQRAQARENASEIVLVGEPLDLDLCHEEQNQVADVAVEHLSAGGAEAAIAYISRLGGRFCALIRTEDALFTVPDATASKSIYWATDNDSVIVGSHVGLVAAFTSAGEQGRPEIAQRPNHRAMPGGYAPALLTAHRDVRPVFANCWLRVTDDGVEHRRFYPATDFRLCRTTEEAYERFSERFEKHVALLCRTDSFVVALDDGLDCRTIMAAALPHMTAERAETATYVSFDDVTTGAIQQFVDANELSLRLGIPHRLLRVKDKHSDVEFIKQFAYTFRAGALNPALVESFANSLADARLLVSNRPNLGAVPSEETEGRGISGELLAEQFSPGSLRKNPDLALSFEDYIAYSQFEPELLHPFDHARMFDWEHRMTRQAGQLYSEADLALNVALPFNQRDIIESLLSLPDRLRCINYIQERYVLERLENGR